MRNRLMMGAAALLLASATFASAQDKPQQGTAASSGSLDIGGRFTSTTGDEARYERYRDLRDGVNANFLFSKQTERWTFDIKALNIGYRDQRYLMDFNSRRLKLSLFFDQTRRTTPTTRRRPTSARRATARSTPACGRASKPGRPWVSRRTSASSPLGRSTTRSPSRSTCSRAATRSPARRASRPPTTSTLRSASTPTSGLGTCRGARLRVQQPPGDAARRRQPRDRRLGRRRVGEPPGHVQGKLPALEVRPGDPDLPLGQPARATDFCRFGLAGQAPGPATTERYINANGPNDGLQSLAPSNTLNTFSWMGMVKLPGRTTANASFSAGSNRQDEALIGGRPTRWSPTRSSTRRSRSSLAAPGFRQYLRELHDGDDEPQLAAAQVRDAERSLPLQRPQRLHASVRRRRVRPLRRGPEETGGESEPFNIDRNAFDVNASFTPIPHTALRVGYGYYKLEHGVRTTEGYQDDTARISFDTVGNAYFTLRAIYEHTKREAIDLSAEALTKAAMQPAARFYDEASRNRDRATFIVDFTPTASLGLNFSYAFGKDDYQEADPSQQFGLLDNKNTAYTVGVSYAPNAKVNLGADYGHETFDAFQQSRNSNPAPDPQWTDRTATGASPTMRR